MINMGNDTLVEMAEQCVLTRTRVISRVLSGIYDEEYRPLGINSSQLTLLLIIYKLGKPSRADIGRFNHQDRSTLTRNLQILHGNGWIEEDTAGQGGRSRPIVLTRTGEALVRSAVEPFRRAQKRAHKILGEAGVNATMDIARGMMKFPGKA